MTVAWENVLADIEDLLAPQLKLDAWERTLYYHLLRHTRVAGKQSSIFGIGPLSRALSLSDFKVRAVLRSLHAKGCVVIDDRSRQGHLVSVVLPYELGTLSRPETSAAIVDVETLDFFTGRKYIAALLERENHSCFYCLRTLTDDTCELDHVVPQMESTDNSFKNVVVACHSCNKGKGSRSAAEFLRDRYRSGLLGEDELRDRLSVLNGIQAGDVKPHLSASDG